MLRRVAIVVFLAAGSCGIPHDPEATSERIASSHELRVGVSDNPPWTRAASAVPQGIEPDLIREFAAQHGAKVLWTRGSETPLVQSLKRNEIDLVIGGFDLKTHWAATAGVTQPFTKDAEGKKHVFLAAPGENRFILSLDRFLTEHMRKAGL